MKKNEEKFRKTSQSQRKFNASTPSISLTHSSPTLLLSLSLPLLLLLPQPALLALAIFAIFAIFAARRRRFFSKHVNRSATLAAPGGGPRELQPVYVGGGEESQRLLHYTSVFLVQTATHIRLRCCIACTQQSLLPCTAPNPVCKPSPPPPLAAGGRVTAAARRVGAFRPPRQLARPVCRGKRESRLRSRPRGCGESGDGDGYGTCRRELEVAVHKAKKRRAGLASAGPASAGRSAGRQGRRRLRPGEGPWAFRRRG